MFARTKARAVRSGYVDATSEPWSRRSDCRSISFACRNLHRMQANIQTCREPGCAGRRTI
jgi:hypothetical protein